MFASEDTLSLDEIYKVHNEINQIKLDLEREALFGQGRLPQEIVDCREKEYNLLYFQRALSAPMIKIYDFIGRPFWQPVSELSDEQISREVDRLLLVLAHYGIEISISYPHANADDRKLYRFIVEEVFPRKIKDIRLPGFCYSIDYNYYCPDDTHSCIFIAESVLTGLFKSDYNGLDNWLAPHFYINNDISEDLYKSVIQKIDSYKSYLDGSVLVDWSIEDIDLDESHCKGVVHLVLQFGSDMNKKPLFTHKGHLLCFKNEKNGWTIHRIDFPGLRLE